MANIQKIKPLILLTLSCCLLFNSTLSYAYLVRSGDTLSQVLFNHVNGRIYGANGNLERTKVLNPNLQEILIPGTELILPTSEIKSIQKNSNEQTIYFHEIKSNNVEQFVKHNFKTSNLGLNQILKIITEKNPDWSLNNSDLVLNLPDKIQPLVHQNFQYETSPIDNSKIVSPTQTLVSTNSQDKHLEPILRWWAFIAPSFFALNATNKINNAKINLGSDINYSFSGMLQYIFNDSFETNTVMEIKKISYLPITNFEIESPEYFFNLAVKTIYQYHSRLAAIATIQNQQLPILSTIIDDQIILTKFNAPVVSLGNRFSLLKTTKHLVNCEFNIGYQLPTVANNQEVESSFNYKLQFDLIFTRPNYLIGQTIYYTTKNDKTELFNQSHREIGFIFGVGF